MTDRSRWRRHQSFRAGIGGNYQSPGWTFMGRPVTIFAQYQHVFVQDGEMNRPAVSPAFNYRFENDLDLFKFGVNVPLGASAPTNWW